MTALQVSLLVAMLAASMLDNVEGLCCKSNLPGTIGPGGISGFGSKQCPDCSWSPTCCATKACNVACCNCDGHCREGDCKRKRRDIDEMLNGGDDNTARRIVQFADKDKDDRLSYAEMHAYLGTKPEERRKRDVEIEAMDLNKDGYLTAQEIDP